MKTLLVTSQVTYVPKNYQSLLEELLKRVSHHVAGVVFLRNFSPSLLKSAGGLYAFGAPNVAGSLARNIFELPFRRREKLVQRYGIPVLSARTINEPSMIEWIRKNEIDLAVNLRTRDIYRDEVLAAPKLGCINVHHGILPDYRGTMCDLFALSQGRPAGFSIHVMTPKIDAGRILLTKEVSRNGDRDYVHYLSRTGTEEGKALADLLDRIASTGKLPRGMANRTANAVYTRTPTGLSEIRRLKRLGMRL